MTGFFTAFLTMASALLWRASSFSLRVIDLKDKYHGVVKLDDCRNLVPCCSL